MPQAPFIMQAILPQPTSPKCRLSERLLSIASTDGGDEPRIHHTAYALNPGVDQAHQIQSVLDTPEALPANCSEASLLVDSLVVLIPTDEYEADRTSTLYDQTITGHEQEVKMSIKIDQLSCVAVFPIDSATQKTLEKRFSNLHIYPCDWSVWLHFLATDQHLHRNPLYGYFHDNGLDIFRFQHDRLRFFNRFAVEQAPDALYFLLNVWRQLGMDAETDHLVLVGPQPAELKERLERHLRHVSVSTPAIDIAERQAADIADMPYDLLLMLERQVKG